MQAKISIQLIAADKATKQSRNLSVFLFLLIVASATSIRSVYFQFSSLGEKATCRLTTWTYRFDVETFFKLCSFSSVQLFNRPFQKFEMQIQLTQVGGSAR